MSDIELIRGRKYIICPICNERAERVGAQDYCDVYLCEKQHITRIKISENLKENDKET